jgi:DNA repair protein RadC
MSISLRLKDQPASERPRERLAARGAQNLRTAELIAILLRTGLKGSNVVEVADRLLARFDNSLNALAGASIEDVRSIKGIGRDKAVTLMAGFALARRMADEIRGEAPLLDTPERVAEFMREKVRQLNTEQFFALHLNTRRRLVKHEIISNGTLDTILVHARDVFRSAIAANAAALVLVHNHPSGDPTPSEADIKVTRDLIRAGQLLKIELLDHVIVGHPTEQRPKGWASLRELGYFYS